MVSQFIQCYNLSWFEMSFCHLVPKTASETPEERKTISLGNTFKRSLQSSHLQRCFLMLPLTPPRPLQEVQTLWRAGTLKSAWPVNGPWMFLEPPHGCSSRKHDASCYIQLIFLFCLFQLCSESRTGFSTPLQCHQQCPAQFHLPLHLLALGYIPRSVCFYVGDYALKWTPDSRFDIFCFPSRPILHPSPPNAIPQEAENQVNYTDSWIQPMVGTSKRSEG